jgi:hypothetical protein
VGTGVRPVSGAGTTVDFAVDQLLGPLFFRRLLAGATFGAENVSLVVDNYPARAADTPSG